MGNLTEHHMAAEDFLELVYGKRRGWIDLPAKVAGFWVPWHYEWEGEADLVISRRIDDCLRDNENLYFSVGQFTDRGRDYEELMPSYWLWADLDEVHPGHCAKAGLAPTICWESSRGRYQALWELDREVSPRALDKLNRALTYHLGADVGGWDRTQVLRIPGTRNFKYEDAPFIEVVWWKEDLAYDPRTIWAKVKASHRSTAMERANGTRPGHVGPLPTRARTLLKVPSDAVVEGERSDRLWELECLLAEAGWGEDAIYAEVSESAWNKWATIRTGEARLRREIRKAIAHVARQRDRSASDTRSSLSTRKDLHDRQEPAGGEVSERGEGSGDEQTLDEAGEDEAAPTSPFVRYASFMAMGMEAPRWLIEDIWTQGGHGIIGGEPKTSKSTLSLAMAVAVASGKPFLGRYPVHVPGPVLMVQEENAPWNVQDRMRKIASSYGLISPDEVRLSSPEVGSIASTSVSLDIRFPDEIPLRLLNNWGFDLSSEEDREMLEAEVQATRPVLVVLDPLYLMFGDADLDKAYQVKPYLQWLLKLRYEYDLAIALVHHFRKASMNAPSGAVRPGQRILGTTTFHGWAASAMYCEALESERDEVVRLRVEREFREMAPQKPWEIELSMGEPGTLKFSAEVREWNVEGQLLALIAEEPGITAVQAAASLGWDKRTVLKRARGSGLVRVEGGQKGRGKSWRLYDANGSGEVVVD